ncbi:MFS transporter [uncultured Capnocytophaga sp.]|uniref:MFS transporter n=1 Tax=uncultured Capnocytophaga sp. TaxID=159273 RepID=UPI002596004F|nr:MFS transporter [uncultured Capnocytophaga sp.]
MLNKFSPTFWVASFLQLMERWAYYGIFTLLGLYLVASTDKGGLGFDHLQKASIMANVSAILYLLPPIFGVIADRIGYKLSLVISCAITAVGYFLMGEVTDYAAVYSIFLLSAVGAGFFKPVVNGIVARNTDETTSTMGFGIFYMMVNIGGFLGPAMSSYLRTEYGWRIIFIQGAVVMTINVLVALFLYKEPKLAQKIRKPLLTEIKESLMHIVEALKDRRLTVLLLLMVGFWTMFNQLFYTLPNFIQDWVDSSAMSQWINQHLPFLGTMLTENGQVKAEWFVNIDSLMIIFFQVVVSYFVTKMTHVSAMIRGTIIGTIGVTLTFMFNNVWFTIIGTMIFSVGEMAASPTLSAFIAQITPKGKEALYQGTFFLPVALGNYLTGFISGNLYGQWSDKYTLLQTEMAKRQIEMPEGLTKKEYFNLASEKLQLSQSQITDLLWNTYEPNKLWYVVCAIGIFAALSLYVYSKVMVRREAK